MRIHFSSIATILVALLFVLGTTGCRSNGGAWYNPKSYAFSNPFAGATKSYAKDKDNLAPPFSSEAQANSKPSLGSHPNISAPQGGYTDGALASRAGSSNASSSSGVTVSNSPPDHWGQQNPMAQQGSANAYGTYSVAEPSQYSPYADYGKQGVAPSSYTSSQNPYQPYQPEMGQQANQPASYNQMSYSSNPLQKEYMPTSAYATQQPLESASAGGYPAVSNIYASSAMPQNDPYASVQQPPAAISQGYGYDQPIQPSYPGASYSAEGASSGSVYQQPYQPPSAGSGYNYNY